MNYEVDELVPIVGKLAEKYTGYESSSITYEKAEQLMGAVLYCIHELKDASCHTLALYEEIPAQRAYEMGLQYVEEKVEKALQLYNKLVPEFCHYENQCLYDTFVKGIPEFFQWYDIRFEPQNTILNLDYPVLKDISAYTGIDKIYEFIRCIYLEQEFLKAFPVDYVVEILSKSNRYWKESMDNISETVLTYVIGHMSEGKLLTEFGAADAHYSCMQEVFMQEDVEHIKKRLEYALEVLIKNYYEGNQELLHYFLNVVNDMSVRFKNAADNE